ncbi:unnamed protein product, partial [Fusarium equiseti]
KSYNFPTATTITDTITTITMKWFTLVFTASAAFVTASPIARSSISPSGPCPEVSFQSKIDAILKGEMDASECCSYGKCKGDVVVSVG